MTALTRPRGPLPGRVYWTRRVLVVVVALGLVFGISRLLHTGGSGAPAETAAPVGGSPTSTPSVEESVPAGPTLATEPASPRKKKALPQPDGPCDDSDVVVTPRVREAHLGDLVKVSLQVTTHESPACYWDVSPESVFVTISRDGSVIWTSQECAGVIPTEQVVARTDTAGKVSFLWNGKESDPACSAATAWARRGTYRVDAVARGATDPQDATFVLGAPTGEPPTPTASPSKDSRGDTQDGKHDGKQDSKQGNGQT